MKRFLIALLVLAWCSVGLADRPGTQAGGYISYYRDWVSDTLWGASDTTIGCDTAIFELPPGVYAFGIFVVPDSLDTLVIGADTLTGVTDATDSLKVQWMPLPDWGDVNVTSGSPWHDVTWLTSSGASALLDWEPGSRYESVDPDSLQACDMIMIRIFRDSAIGDTIPYKIKLKRRHIFR